MLQCHVCTVAQNRQTKPPSVFFLSFPTGLGPHDHIQFINSAFCCQTVLRNNWFDTRESQSGAEK